MVSNPEPQPEFSRLIPVDRLGANEITKEISAEPGECAALARRFGLLALDRLSATLRLERTNAGNIVRVTGRLVAEVTQACVATLKPVNGHHDVAFTVRYGLAAAPAAPPERVVVVETGQEDPPEPVGPDGIDLGEAVAQQLAFALDPYPRAPGAVPPETARAGAGTEPAGKSPFAVLETLKRGP